jgi:hypothetical protein
MFVTKKVVILRGCYQEGGVTYVAFHYAKAEEGKPHILLLHQHDNPYNLGWMIKEFFKNSDRKRGRTRCGPVDYTKPEDFPDYFKTKKDVLELSAVSFEEWRNIRDGLSVGDELGYDQWPDI